MELSEFLWVIKIEVIDDREGVTDGVGQATTACFIETRGEAINDSKKQELPVLRSIFDKLFGACEINFIGNFGRDFVRNLGRDALLESEVLGSSTDSSKVRTSGALMVI